MSDTDRIRHDIEKTRTELSGDVDALADKVRPSSIAHRQADKVRDAVGSLRERVMGVARDVGDTASSVGEGLAHGPRAAAQKAEGHPVAVGLIAFGAGLLLSSLIPASSKERALAADLKGRAEPLTEGLADAARQTAENLAQPARDAADAVTTSAKDAAHEVKDAGASAAQEVRDAVSDSRD